MLGVSRGLVWRSYIGFAKCGSQEVGRDRPVLLLPELWLSILS